MKWISVELENTLVGAGDLRGCGGGSSRRQMAGKDRSPGRGSPWKAEVGIDRLRAFLLDKVAK